MKINIKTPSKAYVQATPEELDSLRYNLTYTNNSAAHDLKRLYSNHWFRNKNKEKWNQAIEETKKRVRNTLVFEDSEGIFIRPGSLSYLDITNIELINEINYPKTKMVAWAKPFKLKPYDYQKESISKLIQIKHGNVELCTGSGKSLIILNICREMGLKTAIIAPSKSIFNELLKKFEYHFGKGKVGAFGAGKKKLGKLFTVCISDSVCNVKEGTKEWEFFSNLDCMIVDESHTFAAETLEEICYGVLSNIPYRMFLSGTQTRNDGTEKLLQSIIGKTVYSLTTKEAIDGNFICPHDYKIVSIESSNPNYNSQDVLDMKRQHFLKNKNICAFIAKLANVAALKSKQQTLILVEELEQISMLMKLLKVPTVYAHSEKKTERLLELGLEKVDPDESVEKFNKCEAFVLIGTSCIATGTNIYPTHNTINWAGGSSEIRTKQGAVGRSVRLGIHNPWVDKCQPKSKATIWDFDVYDVYVMQRHLEERLSFYSESGTEIKFIKLNK